MVPVSSSKGFVSLYQNTGRHVPEDHNLKKIFLSSAILLSLQISMVMR
jgi:hypothetical protein